MTDLELLAIGLFNRFAFIKGKKADWNYLSKERKIEWMKECIVHIDYLVKEINSRVKPAPKPKPKDTSFALGYYSGLQSEKLENEKLLDYLSTNLKNQLKDYINKG